MYPHIITISRAHVFNTQDPQGNKQYIYTLPNIASHLTSTIKQTVQTPTIAWWPDPPAHLHFPLYISTYPLHSTAYPPSHTPYPPAQPQHQYQHISSKAPALRLLLASRLASRLH